MYEGLQVATEYKNKVEPSFRLHCAHQQTKKLLCWNLADKPDLKSGVERREGSSPS